MLAMTRRGASHFATASGGMSLIEVLVALAVVSVGMIGIASLVLHGLRAGHTALLRTQAVNLVSDMQERIRANPGAGGAYDCAAYPGGPSERNCAPGAGVPQASSCTPSELAEDDLARWQNAARGALPFTGADPCEANVVYVPPSAPDALSRYRVSVSWPQRGGGAPAVYRSDILLASPPGMH
jgi:type IV pilus assembly protein PilV